MENKRMKIGLEIHAQMNTNSKLFSGSRNGESENPNENVELFDLAFPGVFPRINEEAINKAIKIGLGLNCTIEKKSRFDRKHYNYPDLPMGFQITQFYKPICINGYLELDSGKKIRINRIHLETDAGKLVHEGQNSLIDYNRCGVPLMEIVTDPDLNSPEEVQEFLELLIRTLKYTDVCNCNMEKGNLRVDINISIPSGQRIEVKNVNSLNFIKKAIEHEYERQTDLITKGIGVNKQETRGFNSENFSTYFMREKESELDYRYIRDFNIQPIIIEEKTIENIKSTMEEMPFDRKKRYQTILSNKEIIDVLLSDKKIGDFFDQTNSIYRGKNNYLIGNIIVSEIMKLINQENGLPIDNIKITPAYVSEMVNLLDDNVISSKILKTIIADSFKTGNSPKVIVKEKGLSKITDADFLREILGNTIKNFSEQFTKIKIDPKLKQFFIGEVMKETKGKADPIITSRILQEFIDKNL